MSQRVACAGEVKQEMRSRRETESEKGGQVSVRRPETVVIYAWPD
jgi:hypothetical protein